MEKFRAKQTEKYKGIRGCFGGSRCTNPGCTHGHSVEEITAANVRCGFIHEIETRVAEFQAIEAASAEIDKMIAADQVDLIDEAEQDAFALADAEHDEEIQAAAEEFFAEQELIDELNTVFETVAAAVPQTPKKSSWATVVKQAPGAPKKINRLMFSDVENWGDIE